MITDLPVPAIPRLPKSIASYGYSPKTRPAFRLPQTDSILELFELAARQTPDPELVASHPPGHRREAPGYRSLPTFIPAYSRYPLGL